MKRRVTSSAIGRSVRIYPWRRIRRSRAPSRPGTFFAAQFSAGCTTNISGFDLRQAHLTRVSVGEHWADDGDFDEAHVHSHDVDPTRRFSAAMQHDIPS